MAVPARKRPKKKNLPSTSALPTVPESQLTEVQALAAQLLGRGYSVGQVAERMVDYIIQNSKRPRTVRLKMARNRIRSWQKRAEFRDVVWNNAVVRLDNETPQILAGIAKKAKAGRVDAAKLALAVTERYSEKAEEKSGNVVVVFDGLPRPQRSVTAAPEEEVVDGEAVEEE